MSNRTDVFKEAGTAYPWRAPGFTPGVWFLFCPMLPVSLDYSFLIAPSVFSSCCQCLLIVHY